MTDASGIGISAETQIKIALHEGLENIARAIFGENLTWELTYGPIGPLVDGFQPFQAKVVNVRPGHDDLVVESSLVHIVQPDEESIFYRIADYTFSVKASGWAKNFLFVKAWCEHNPYNGSQTIVRHSVLGGATRWLVADSMEAEVSYRGEYERLPSWAKEIVQDKWREVSAA